MSQAAGTVLVLEDNATNQAAVHLMLLRRGWDVIVAVDAEDAVERYAGAAVDMVLVDSLATEQVVGAAFQRIAQAQRRSAAPIVVTQKPIKAAELYRMVDRFCPRREAA